MIGDWVLGIGDWEEEDRRIVLDVLAPCLLVLFLIPSTESLVPNLRLSPTIRRSLAVLVGFEILVFV
ncbi:hypothetical protein PCC6912_49800 [Chlorogloeopsis fritschii PCC 6912]|uniref:Uncharacterized protein n=1 Tax=Chlorogloeopsis fritschii PCC 6912 TaxID=211165 RepID=A0A3S0Y2N7_CHLFR|nr:hypothetical protein PCC6912_49800 [Chlorogloeopsis fritschii PCC 6912]